MSRVRIVHSGTKVAKSCVNEILCYTLHILNEKKQALISKERRRLVWICTATHAERLALLRISPIRLLVFTKFAELPFSEKKTAHCTNNWPIMLHVCIIKTYNFHVKNRLVWYRPLCLWRCSPLKQTLLYISNFRAYFCHRSLKMCRRRNWTRITIL
jgi:hypothetical protein